MVDLNPKQSARITRLQHQHHAAKQRCGFLCFLGLHEALPQLGLHTKKTGGFTLLEMLVVIALLGAIATISLSAFDSTVDDSVVLMTQTEMVEISRAIRNFKRDNGSYPNLTHPADFSELISGTPTSPPAGYNPWNINTARGWRGPYLSKQGGGLVKVCNTLLDDGTGSPIGCASTDVIEVNSVADAFEHTFTDNGNTMVWRACTDAGNTACNEREKWGRPYLLFDMNNVNARIVSMGPDGHYDGVNATYPCAPNNDDLVLCLK